MNNNVKELRKLNRKELLEIILEQLKRINQLENLLEEKEEKINSKRIDIKEAGSIAEAALKLSGIFEIAQEACNNYLDNVNKNCLIYEKQVKKENNLIRKKMIEDTEIKCQKMIEDAKKEAESLNKKNKLSSSKKKSEEVKSKRSKRGIKKK